MLKVQSVTDPDSGHEILETNLHGKALLTSPQLNKNTAFSIEERIEFGLLGKLPQRVETLEEQATRAYEQYQRYSEDFNRNVYLNALLNSNQTLFYKLVSDHLADMMPMIYTPSVGQAVKAFSHKFRQARGLYLSYPDARYFHSILENRTNADIDLIVVTDGEGVLGIGDQGIGAMDIPIAKLMVYTLCGGINPSRTLPIMLDVGTNNEELLNDPFYLGWQQPRIQGKEYDDFIALFVHTLQEAFPNVFLHWEDFGRNNARKNLDRFRHELCSFNDDIQGTAVVTLAALLAAVKAKGETLGEQRIVIYGAGTAGMGICDAICKAIEREGIDIDKARQCFYCFDRQGLLTCAMEDLTPAQAPYARPVSEVETWSQTNDRIDLVDAIDHIKPTIMIGCSAQSGAFNEQIVKRVARHCPHPIIFPLSNPNEKAEATPEDLMKWTDGKVAIATGSPFAPVKFNGEEKRIAQCNNALAFPGIGLGITALKAKFCSDDMLWAATQALANTSPALKDPNAPVLPDVTESHLVSSHVATALAEQAIKEAHAEYSSNEDLTSFIKRHMWVPKYTKYRRID